jgi:hypothetical protein
MVAHLLQRGLFHPLVSFAHKSAAIFQKPLAANVRNQDRDGVAKPTVRSWPSRL